MITGQPSGYSEQTYIAHIWCFGNELKAEADRSGNAIYLDPDRNWDMHPIRETEEEFQKKTKPSGQFAGHTRSNEKSPLDILCSQLISLTRQCLIGERNLVILGD